MDQRTTPINILLVEDDARIAALLSTYLGRHNIEVVQCACGLEGVRLAQGRVFDVVVLDIMLPNLDGLSVCRQIRSTSTVPIIMVTALGEEVDRVTGLELGADDYMVKPISARELLARIRALVRRATTQRTAPEPKVELGDLTLLPGAMRAQVRGCDIELTSYQFLVLSVLAKNAGRVLSREQLMDQAKGAVDEAFDRSIDVQISRIRKKLGDGARTGRIRTVRGAGYLFVTGE